MKGKMNCIPYTNWVVASWIKAESCCSCWQHAWNLVMRNEQ